MAQPASKIECYTFVNTPSSKALVFDENGNPVDVRPEELTDSEAGAYLAMSDALAMAVDKNGTFKYENIVSPWDFGNNNVLTKKLGIFTYPSALIRATYPDGSGKQYVLGKDFIDKVLGGIWDAKEIYPYIRLLLLNLKPKEGRKSLLCQLYPPLCSISGLVWLGLAAGTTLKAANSHEGKRIAWGGVAVLLWSEWYQRDGPNQLKELLKNK